MKQVQIKDELFELYIERETIEKQVISTAEKLNKKYSGKSVLFLPVLNGSFMFFADLMKHIDLECEINFLKYNSYAGTESTGKVSTRLGPDNSAESKHVIIVEDVVDTGKTIEKVMGDLKMRNPESVSICSLLLKPDRYNFKYPVDFSAFEIPDDFVVGYGLDYDGKGRNLTDIYKIVPQQRQ